MKFSITPVEYTVRDEADPYSRDYVSICLRDEKAKRWAVVSAASQYVWSRLPYQGRMGSWVREPSPSNRDATFLSSTRFTWEEAVEFAKVALQEELTGA